MSIDNITIDPEFKALNPTLVDLAIRINKAHAACERDLRSGLSHAVEAGRLLMEAKAATAHGSWLSWVGANCEFSARTAQQYMRLASRFGGIDSQEAQRAALLSARAALAMVSPGKKALSPPEPDPVCAPLVAHLVGRSETQGPVPGWEWQLDWVFDGDDEPGVMIHVDPEFDELLPAHRPCEWEAIEQSIITHGCIVALYGWPQADGSIVLLDGHARLVICRKHRAPFTMRSHTFSDRDSAMAWILRQQLGRKNLSDDEIATITVELKTMADARGAD